MKMLRQLIQDAQSVLRDMSTTQRVAVTALILTAAGWLTGAAWFGTRTESAKEVAIGWTYEPEEYREIEELLQKQGGFTSARYDPASKMFMVPARDEEAAVLFLAAQRKLGAGRVSETALDAMGQRISFTDTSLAVGIRERNARAATIARVITKLDNITEADVIYSDDRRASLFLGTAPLKASVLVKTKLGRPLTDATAQTIIDLVAHAKSGLDPDRVVVTDQTANRRFLNQDGHSALARANDRFALERQYDERLHDKIERLLRVRLPNLADGGAVTIESNHRVNTDDVRIAEMAYSEGAKTETRGLTVKERSTEGPPYEPGVQPNVGTSSRVDAENAGAGEGGYRRETSRDQKETYVRNQPSHESKVTLKAPELQDARLSVTILLPYEFERDENGRAVPDVDEYGDPILDPLTRKPRLKRKSTAPLTDEEVRKLTLQFANVAGIDPEDAADKVVIDQLAWRPSSVHADPGAPPMSAAVFAMVRENFFAIFAAAALLGMVVFLYAQARQNLQTELDDEVDEGEVSENLKADVPEEDPAQTEMEATRMRVREAVMEDPKRAAMLVRRWMSKEG